MDFLYLHPAPYSTQGSIGQLETVALTETFTRTFLYKFPLFNTDPLPQRRLPLMRSMRCFRI